MFNSHKENLAAAIYLGRQERFREEKKQINQSFLCLDLNSIKSKVPIYTVLQILLKREIGDSGKIDLLSEEQITRFYRSFLLTLKSEMDESEKFLSIESEMLPRSITKAFIKNLTKDGLPEGNDLEGWWEFSKKYEEFFVPIVKIKKYLLLLDRYQHSRPQKSSQTTKSRQEFLIKTFNSLCEEDQALLFETPQGKIGLKSKIRKSISDPEFKLYFADIDHNFDNAWKAVRRALISKK